jgi:hypothetical protein
MTRPDRPLHRTAHVIFAAAPGTDLEDANDTARLAIRQALSNGRHHGTSTTLITATHRDGSTDAVQLSAIHEVGVAANNGYLRISPTSRAFSNLPHLNDLHDTLPDPATAADILDTARTLLPSLLELADYVIARASEEADAARALWNANLPSAELQLSHKMVQDLILDTDPHERRDAIQLRLDESAAKTNIAADFQRLAGSLLLEPPPPAAHTRASQAATALRALATPYRNREDFNPRWSA